MAKSDLIVSKGRKTQPRMNRGYLSPMSLKSNMPAGASESPCGDLGELKQLEALKVFPALKKMTDHVKRASHKLPAPKGWIK